MTEREAHEPGPAQAVQPTFFTEANQRAGDDDFPGEKVALQGLVADMKRIVGPLQAISSLTPGAADVLDKLEDSLRRLPSTGKLAEAVDSFKEKAARVIAASRRARVIAFGRIEADFIRELRASGETVRELSEGWRVGPLELQLKREQAQCRALYNGEPVTAWLRVGSLNDLRRIRRAGLDALKRVAIPEDKLREIFTLAYNELHFRRQSVGSGGRISLRDFYPELRLALVRHDLSRKAEAPLSFPDFPLWAFLYNLDRYRRLAHSIPNDERLTLHTGSQAETRRLGLIVNGLDASQEYTKVCFISRG